MTIKLGQKLKKRLGRTKRDLKDDLEKSRDGEVIGKSVKKIFWTRKRLGKNRKEKD